MGYAAEIIKIFYSQGDYQMVNISRILKFFTWHGFDEFGWNDPIFSSFDCNPSLEVRLIFLDISKACDKVLHEGLFYKPKSLGISVNVLNLI